MTAIEILRSKWKRAYSEVLPAKARANDSNQKCWPITLGHCFARIILDKVIGEGGKPWTKKVQSPAIMRMSEGQLSACIELAEEIEHGKVDLVELNKASLKVRGHTNKTDKEEHVAESSLQSTAKRKADETDLQVQPIPPESRPTKKRQSTLNFARTALHASSPSLAISEPQTYHGAIIRQINNHPTLTPYRKRLYRTLMSVPQGRFTTYAAISDYLKSSARAVGNGMRNNPFAPQVPCHRVLAADGSIGGFGGSWGKDGKHSDKKVKLLAEEGVNFDRKGKAIGDPFRDFGSIK